MIGNPKEVLSLEWMNKWMGGEWRHRQISAECRVWDHFEFWWHSAVVQLLSRVQLSATPWTAARQASLSTISWNLLGLMSIQSGMPSNQLILCTTRSKNRVWRRGWGQVQGRERHDQGVPVWWGAQRGCLCWVNPWKPSYPWTRSVSRLDGLLVHC